jgi:hypothetical protein
MASDSFLGGQRNRQVEAIQQQHSMGALDDLEGYLVDMQLHHVGVGMGRCEGCADAAGRANGAEEIGVLIASIGGLGGPRAAPDPLAGKAVLLAVT